MSALENVLPRPKIELYSGKFFLACGLGGIIGRFESLSLWNCDMFVASKIAPQSAVEQGLSKANCFCISLIL